MHFQIAIGRQDSTRPYKRSKAGRHPVPIEVTLRLAAVGIDQAIFSMPNVSDLEPFDLLKTEIIPEVDRIPVAGR